MEKIVKYWNINFWFNKKFKNWMFQLQQPIKPKYEARESPLDNVNGFDGAIEYDCNWYLTNLLIAANVLDKQF